MSNGEIKISEMVYESILGNDDLVEISKKNGDGSYSTRSTKMSDIVSVVKSNISISDCIYGLYTGTLPQLEGVSVGDVYGYRLSEFDEYKFFICTRI